MIESPGVGKPQRRLLLASAAFVVASLVFAFFLAFQTGGSPGSEERRLRRAVLDNPLDAVARIELATLLAGKKGWTEAVVTLQGGTRLAPEDISLPRALARIYADWAEASQDENKLQRAGQFMQVVINSGKATAEDYEAFAEGNRSARNYKEAAWAFGEAFKRAPDQPDLRRRAYNARLFAGYYEEARDFYQDVVDKNPADGAALHNLALALSYLGDYRGAEANLRKRLQIPHDDGHAESQEKLEYVQRLQLQEKDTRNFKAHYDLGRKHKLRGRFDRAIVELETAVALSTETSETLAKAYNDLGYLASMMNDWEMADRYAEPTVAVCREVGDLYQLSHAYQGLALMYGRKARGNPPRRTEFLEKALAAHQLQLEAARNYGEYFMEVRSLADLTSCARDLYGLEDERTKKYRAQLAPHLPKNDEPIQVSALASAASTEAGLRMEEKDFAGAEKLLLQGAGAKMDSHEKRDASVYNTLVRLACMNEQYEKGIEYARKGIEFLTSFRMQMGSDSARQQVGGQLWLDLFKNLVQCAMGKGDTALIFDYSEQYKARALLELLRTKANTQQGRERLMLAKAEPAPGFVGEVALQSKEGMAAPAKTRDLLIEQTHYPRLPEDASVAGRQVASYKPAPTLKAAEARAMADEFTFISYGIDNNAAMAIVLTHDSVNVIELPGATERILRDVIDKFRKGLGLKDGIQRDLHVEGDPGAQPSGDERDTALRESLQQLYDGLIAPVRPYINTRLVYISADGILNYLPFEALQNNGRYLLEDYAIAYAPSATVLKQCMDKERHNRSSVLALGNPNLQNPAFRLVNAEEEVQALSDLFQKADVLTGDAANERAVKERAGQYDVLHIACHGELNLDDPMLSSLRLSPDGANDGYLHAGEVFDLDLTASLVVLSACNTGLGELHAGNELMGLTRSFLYAGAPSIVASLWTVDDRSTAYLMREFYKNLATMNKADALQQAKLATMRQYPNPFHWAAFCLQGDYRN